MDTKEMVEHVYQGSCSLLFVVSSRDHNRSVKV